MLLTEPLPVLFFLMFYKRNTPRKLVRVIVLLVIISFFSTLLISVLGANHIHNAWVQDIYLLIETIILIYFFSKCIPEIFKFKYAIILSSAFSILWLLNNLKMNFATVEPISYVLEVIIIMVLSTIFFYRQTNMPKMLFVYESSFFWIVIGQFIYLTGTLFLYLYWHKLSKEDQIKYYYLNDVFSVIRSVLLSIAMIIKEKQDKPPVNNYPMQYTL